jgi:hypothetical protein
VEDSSGQDEPVEYRTQKSDKPLERSSKKKGGKKKKAGGNNPQIIGEDEEIEKDMD